MKSETEITTEDILEHWRQGKSTFDWRSLTIKGKIEWLKACLHWTGLPMKRIPALNYAIEGNQVSSRYDYYCLLGEVFFGYRGYFGMNLDAWYDCFSEVYLYEKSKSLVEKGAKVTFKDSEKMKAALEADYFAEIVKGFKEQGFEIELE